MKKENEILAPIIKNLHEKGMTDKEMAEILDCERGKVQYIRRKVLDIDPNPNTFPKVCIECGKPYVAQRRASTKCESCRNVRAQKYFAICNMRSQFAQLCETNPERALEIYEEMKKIEGGNFTETALDGIPEKLLLKED